MVDEIGAAVIAEALKEDQQLQELMLGDYTMHRTYDKMSYSYDDDIFLYG
jgi:hypothetical protein